MPDVVYRVVQTKTKTVDVTVPEEIVKQGFDACRQWAIQAGIVLYFAPGSSEVKETLETKAFMRTDGLG